MHYCNMSITLAVHEGTKAPVTLEIPRLVKQGLQSLE